MRRFVILLAVVIFVSPVVARAIQPASDASMRLESFTGVVTNGSNEVSQWTDQPITDHNATQSVAADEPTLVQSVFNGLPGLSFNNSTDYMNVAGTILSSQQFSIFAVCTDTIGNGSLREILDNWAYNTNEGTSVFFGTTGSSPDTVRFTDSDASAGTVASPSQPFVLSAMSNSNGAEVYQDQTLLSSNAALTTRNFSTPFCISRQGTTGPFWQEFWAGDIGAILVYDRQLTPAEWLQTTQYLESTYLGMAVPEPSTIALLLAGGACLLGYVWRRRA